MGNSGSFVKGDPRINRKGRPRSFKDLRKLARLIADEKATKKGGKTLVVGNHSVTVVEAILRGWATDKNKQKSFIEVAYGKVPDKLDITSDGESINKISGKIKRDLLDRIKSELEETQAGTETKPNK